jgi:hypothetical protein
MGHGWLRGEDWWGDPMSLNMAMADALLHPVAESMTLTAPPDAVAVGDQFIVPPGATGLWDGFDDSLATFTEDGWLFLPLFKGLRVRVLNLDSFFWWTGSSWSAEPASGNSDPAQGTRYDISISVGYAAEPFEVLLVLPIVQAMQLAAQAPGSMAVATDAPPAAVTLNIKRNGNKVGSVLFPTTDFKGVFSIASTVVFAPGDRLTVEMGAAAPESFKAFGVVLRLALMGS